MGAPKGHAAYNTNGEGGRPYKYDEAALDLFADKLIAWLDGNTIPFIQDFCYDNGIFKQDISDFCARSKRFKEAYNKFKIRQEGSLLKGSLIKNYDYKTAYLVLNTQHGYIIKNDERETEEKKGAAAQMGALFDQLSGLQQSLKNSKTIASKADKSACDTDE